MSAAERLSSKFHICPRSFAFGSSRNLEERLRDEPNERLRERLRTLRETNGLLTKHGTYDSIVDLSGHYLC